MIYNRKLRDIAKFVGLTESYLNEIHCGRKNRKVSFPKNKVRKLAEFYKIQIGKLEERVKKLELEY